MAVAHNKNFVLKFQNKLRQLSEEFPDNKLSIIKGFPRKQIDQLPEFSEDELRSSTQPQKVGNFEGKRLRVIDIPLWARVSS